MCRKVKVMFELLVRLATAALFFGAAIAFRKPDLATAGLIGGGFAAYSGLVYWVEQKGLRNSGIAGFVAVLDAAFIAGTLAQIGELERFGFMVLAPLMWATGRFGSDAASMTPLVAATVMVSSNFIENEGFTLPIMLHTAGILLVGLLTNQAKVVLKETQVPVEITKEVRVKDAADMKAQEGYRQLKEHVQDVEKKSRRDRVAMRVYVSSSQSDEPMAATMADTMVDACETAGAAVYYYDSQQRRMVAQAYSGLVPKSVRDLSFDVPSGLGDGQLKHQLEQRFMRLRDPDSPLQIGSVLLKDKGRLLGMVVLFDKSAVGLDTAVRIAGDAAEALGPMVSADRRKEDFARRLKETEILYGVASVGLGAETPRSLVSRVLRELGETIRLDHMAVFFVEGGEAIQITSFGAANRLFEDISFAGGTGLEGWQAIDCPEVYIPDALDDDRVEKAVSMKRRVGSYLMVPLEVSGRVYGFISAATHSANGIDSAKHGTLKAIADETSQAIARIENPGEDTGGVMVPTEFYAAVRGAGNGHLVYFDVLRRDENIDKFGRPAFDHALRKLTMRLRTKLPVGGALCRRDEGDYVAFLPTLDEAIARSWSNEATAMASMIGLTTPDGRARIPLALRSKVALLRQQKNQVSAEKTA